MPQPHGEQRRCCKVPECTTNLASDGEYSWKHKACTTHRQDSEVLIAGVWQRWCQRCTKFQPVTEFVGSKRSCEKLLTKLKKRRMRQAAEYYEEDSEETDIDEPDADIPCSRPKSKRCKPNPRYNPTDIVTSPSDTAGSSSTPPPTASPQVDGYSNGSPSSRTASQTVFGTQALQDLINLNTQAEAMLGLAGVSSPYPAKESTLPGHQLLSLPGAAEVFYKESDDRDVAEGIAMQLPQTSIGLPVPPAPRQSPRGPQAPSTETSALQPNRYDIRYPDCYVTTPTPYVTAVSSVDAAGWQLQAMTSQHQQLIQQRTQHSFVQAAEDHARATACFEAQDAALTGVAQLQPQAQQEVYDGSAHDDAGDDLLIPTHLCGAPHAAAGTGSGNCDPFHGLLLPAADARDFEGGVLSPIDLCGNQPETFIL